MDNLNKSTIMSTVLNLSWIFSILEFYNSSFICFNWAAAWGQPWAALACNSIIFACPLSDPPSWGFWAVNFSSWAFACGHPKQIQKHFHYAVKSIHNPWVMNHSLWLIRNWVICRRSRIKPSEARSWTNRKKSLGSRLL